MKETNHILQNIIISVNILIKSELVLSSQALLLPFSSIFFQKVDKMWKTRGSRGTLAYFKEVRLVFTRWLSGSPLNPKDLTFTIGMTHDGLPSILSSALPLIRRGATPPELRVLLTIMN